MVVAMLDSTQRCTKQVSAYVAAPRECIGSPCSRPCSNEHPMADPPVALSALSALARTSPLPAYLSDVSYKVSPRSHGRAALPDCLPDQRGQPPQPSCAGNTPPCFRSLLRSPMLL